MSSDVQPPLSFISKADHAGLVAVITALALSFVLVSFLIRVYIRYSTGPWKPDDHIFTAVTVSLPHDHDPSCGSAAINDDQVFSCVQSAVVFYSIGKGLGKVDYLVSPSDRNQRQMGYFACTILNIFTNNLTNTS